MKRALDLLVEARGLVDRQEQRAMLRVDVDGAREHPVQHGRVVEVERALGVARRGVDQLLEQAEHDVGEPVEVAVEDRARQARLGHHGVDREVAEAGGREQPRGGLDDASPSLGARDAAARRGREGPR